MKSQLHHLSFFSALLLIFSTMINVKSVQAGEIAFDYKKCIQSFVSQGLSTNEAKDWCENKKDCLEASAQEGLPPDAAESVCNCSINEFKKRYTTQEFEDLTAQARVNESVKEKLREVGEACFENILFED